MFEVTLADLNRCVSAVVREVEREGAIVVVSRHGRAAALLLPLPEAIEWLPGWMFSKGPAAELGAEFARRADAKAHSARMHGRWARPDR
jgi:prevent-host-death family protein